MRAALAPTAVHVIPPLPAGWFALRYAVLVDGVLGILATDENIHAELSKNDPTPTAHELAARSRARIWTFDGGRLAFQIEFPLETPFPMLDALPGGRWIVAAARTDAEPNARLIGADGELLSRIMIGDGIQHMKTDARGRVWVGWLDEGIFGNNDWKIAGRRWPPSASGIACFDHTGEVVWEYLSENPGEPIVDCYALNVSGDVAWACPYTDFDILRLSTTEKQRRWKNELGGPEALAISGSDLLLAGGYGPEADRLALLHLDGAEARLRATWSWGAGSASAAAPRLIDARGGMLHIVHGSEWRLWSAAAVARGVNAAAE